jgi:glycosyltransferase involved in cell wall biosynthesis
VRVRTKIDPVAILQMKAVIQKGNFDVVHSHLSTSSVNGSLAARAARVPGFASVHGMSGKGSFVFADHLIAVSNQVKQHLIRQGLDDAKISVVYNGYDGGHDPFASGQEQRASLGIGPKELVIGTVARITALKGIADALRALALVRPSYPNLRYLLVGDGEALADCQALSQELGLAEAVIYAGYQDDVRPYLAAMDMFLFPSHKEAMGIALVEAMVAGLPIVSTDVDGIPEVLTPGTAVLTPPREPEQMASAILRVLSQPDRGAAMADAGQQRAKNVFSPSAMQVSTEAVYRKLLPT